MGCVLLPRLGLLREARDAGEAVEARVESEDLLDAVLFHDGQVHGITGGHVPAPQDNPLCAFSDATINRQNLIGNPEKSIECGLNSIATVDGDVAAQNLLQHLRIGHETLTIADQFFEQSLRIALVRVRCTDKVHRDIRVNKNHG